MKDNIDMNKLKSYYDLFLFKEIKDAYNDLGSILLFMSIPGVLTMSLYDTIKSGDFTLDVLLSILLYAMFIAVSALIIGIYQSTLDKYTSGIFMKDSYNKTIRYFFYKKSNHKELWFMRYNKDYAYFPHNEFKEYTYQITEDFAECQVDIIYKQINSINFDKHQKKSLIL